MSRKDKASYTAIFEEIKRNWARLDCRPQFERFLTDFEEAEYDAVAFCFGEDKVKFFHFARLLCTLHIIYRTNRLNYGSYCSIFSVLKV